MGKILSVSLFLYESMKLAKPPFQKQNILQHSLIKRSRKKMVFLLWIGVPFVLAILAVFFVAYGNFFTMREINISGERLLSESEVRIAVITEIERASFLARVLGPEHSVFWFFAKSHYSFSTPTELEFVSLNFDFWPRRVSIEVTERSVAHIICRPQENVCYGVTESGMIFAKIPEVRGALILRLEDNHSDIPIVLGAQYFGNQTFLPHVYEVSNILGKENIIPVILRVRDRQLYEWEAVLGNGPTLYFSGFFVPRNLVGVLNDIRRATSFENLTYIDFRVQDKIFYK